jgi:hypothetical protein
MRIVGSLFFVVTLAFLIVGSGSAKAASINVPKPILPPRVVPFCLPARVFASKFYPQLFTRSIAFLTDVMLLDELGGGN